MNNTAQVPPVAQGPQALLGITAKSSSPCELEKASVRRFERFKALSQARAWLASEAQRIDPEAHSGDLFRTIDCRWSRILPFVEVKFSGQHQVAHYAGLATCGSVWACPVCCATIQQRRRPEIAALIEWAYAQGYEAQMVTFTFPHTSFDSLGDLISRQREAFRILRSGKVWQAFKASCDFQGLVRSLEVTHGGNGWHPHTHELWITKPLSPAARVVFSDTVSARWEKACIKSGLLDGSDSLALRHFRNRAVDVRFSASSSEYLVKQDSGRAWGADRELAASASKTNSRATRHPHDFLVTAEHDERAIYLEYVEGMKGQRQLFWSPNLKARVGVEEITDAELVESEAIYSDLLGMLSPDQWQTIRGNDCRAEILTAAERGGWPSVFQILQRLGCS